MAKQKSNGSTWSKLKPCILNMDRKQLVKLVADMYRFSKDNQIFLHSRFGIGKDLLEPYKKTIDECMYLDLCSKETIQISKAEKTISNYTKAAGDILGEVELMVYFVECGNNFTIGFGDIDEEFYNSLNEMYRRAINKVLSLPENQQKEFQDRLKEIMISSSDIGWCYHDTLSNDYYDAFSEEEES